MKRKILFLAAFLVSTISEASVTDTIHVYSKSMKKNVPVVIILPDNHASAGALPVVYLLHGYRGNHLDWISKAPGFEKLPISTISSSSVGRGFNSVWDSLWIRSQKYETFVSDEL
jgi:S-formylglutathione hydrolase FrmB